MTSFSEFGAIMSDLSIRHHMDRSHVVIPPYTRVVVVVWGVTYHIYGVLTQDSEVVGVPSDRMSVKGAQRR